MLVRDVIFRNQMQVAFYLGLLIVELQELQPLLMAVSKP
jgi:hypothetical protein